MRIKFEPFILKKAYCCICGNKLGRKIICVREEYTYKPFGLSLLKEKKRSYLCNDFISFSHWNFNSWICRYCIF